MKTAQIILTKEQQKNLAPLLQKMESITDDHFVGIAQLQIPDEHNDLSEPVIKASVLTGFEAWMVTEDVNDAMEKEQKKGSWD